MKNSIRRKLDKRLFDKYNQFALDYTIEAIIKCFIEMEL